MTGRAKGGSGIRRKAGSGTAGEPKAFGKTTLSEAYRERLAMPVVHPELLKEYKEATGERLEEGSSPTWATFIAAMTAHRAAMSATGTRDAKELREATEQEDGNSEGEPPIVLGIKGLPRTNAVTGQPAEETDEEWEGQSARGASSRSRHPAAFGSFPTLCVATHCVRHKGLRSR